MVNPTDSQVELEQKMDEMVRKVVETSTAKAGVEVFLVYAGGHDIFDQALIDAFIQWVSLMEDIGVVGEEPQAPPSSLTFGALDEIWRQPGSVKRLLECLRSEMIQDESFNRELCFVMVEYFMLKVNYPDLSAMDAARLTIQIHQAQDNPPSGPPN